MLRTVAVSEVVVKICDVVDIFRVAGIVKFAILVLDRVVTMSVTYANCVLVAVAVTVTVFVKARAGPSMQLQADEIERIL